MFVLDHTQAVLKLISLAQAPISGEKIAAQLNITRAAVWKIIQVLQKKGYPIISHRRLGYEYRDDGFLNQYLIQAGLTPALQTQLKFELHQTIDSTNLRAKQLCVAQSVKSPLVILSDRQTAGYGRYGRNYSCPSRSGIYLSILLPNQATILNPGLLTTATALAVSYTIEQQLHLKPQIKWVNDLMLDQKKIVGILTEAVSDIESRSIGQVIVGIGINYLTEIDQLPESVQQTAGSLRAAVRKIGITRNQFIAALLNHFFELYQHYQTGDFLPAYRQRCFLLQQQVTITQGNHKFTDQAVDIDNQGRLVLADGQHISSGEITRIRLK
ncbi:MAG: biotin--[acetyl-CoA-carboxylase] ligase [Liquorilactobacillus ghanensis]|uniref:Bifunctional ligase/repressor BirA n=1 Tax=Liquorilactobacillus ghanensis DSM 18630 TaxID=1423750 RepID=A0A0R1VR86_9LACO|nr:biotin operon repressor biotin--[acetyl-CoA-carboxylase] synthetase [Liquorilactobacillus ghanensis DSM 18630]